MGVRFKLTANKPTAEQLRKLYCDDHQTSIEIAAIYHVAFGTVCQWLRKYNIPRRSFSEAANLLQSQRSYDDKLRNSAKSRAIITGRRRSLDDLRKRATGKQEQCQSTYELEIIDRLNTKGIFPILNLAVDKYNVDLAFPEIKLAIEINGGCWHNTPKKKKQDSIKRLFLESNGWKVLYFQARSKCWADNCINDILTTLQCMEPT